MWMVTPRRWRLGADQVELVLGAVDQDHPGPPVPRVAGLGLAERGGDHLGGVVFAPTRPAISPRLWAGAAACGARAGRRAGR